MTLIDWGGSETRDESHLLPSGELSEVRKVKYQFTNTCSLDNVLQLLYFVNTYSKDGVKWLSSIDLMRPNNNIDFQRVFREISNGNFYRAKRIWYSNFNDNYCDTNLKNLVLENNRKVNCEANEYDVGVSQIFHLFPATVRYNCYICNVEFVRTKSFAQPNQANVDLWLQKINNRNLADTTRCPECQGRVMRRYEFVREPLKYVMFHLFHPERRANYKVDIFTEEQLSEYHNIQVLGSKYELIFYSLKDDKRWHFFSVFNTVPQMRYDGMVINKLSNHTPTKLPVCVLMYKLADDSELT